MLSDSGQQPRYRCAVLGSPIAHSLSPAMHLAAYAELGLDWDYERHEVNEQTLQPFVDAMDRSWRGLSLTMPLKRVVVPLLHELSDRAAQAQAVNTMVVEGGRRTGHNTDIPGASAAVRERYDGPLDRALIVGGGATAASTLLGLADLGCRHVTIVVRDAARAASTVATAARHPSPPRVEVVQVGAAVPPADILVSTVPAEGQTDEAVALAESVPVVFDVTYEPWPTRFAQYATGSGKVLVSGLDLLVHQAVVQVELMTGVPQAPLEVMRRAGEATLAARAVTET